jgi:Uma2 family endonuclease
MLGRRRGSADIPEYWIIEVPDARVRVFRLNARSRYEETMISHGTLAVQDFPDVVVRLQDLF